MIINDPWTAMVKWLPITRSWKDPNRTCSENKKHSTLELQWCNSFASRNHIFDTGTLFFVSPHPPKHKSTTLGGNKRIAFLMQLMARWLKPGSLGSSLERAVGSRRIREYLWNKPPSWDGNNFLFRTQAFWWLCTLITNPPTVDGFQLVQLSEVASLSWSFTDCTCCRIS